MIASLLHLAETWGPNAISAVLVIVIIHMNKQLGKNSKMDAQRFSSLQDDISGMANSLRQEIKDQLKALTDNIQKQLDEHSRQIEYIKVEYTRKEDFLRDLGGWRADLNRLSDQIHDLSKTLINLIRGKDL